MKLVCKGEYHNPPADLNFEKAGVIDVDDAKALFLLRDAPDNFEPYVEPAAPDQLVQPAESADASKALDAPPVDKQVKNAPKKK